MWCLEDEESGNAEEDGRAAMKSSVSPSPSPPPPQIYKEVKKSVQEVGMGIGGKREMGDEREGEYGRLRLRREMRERKMEGERGLFGLWAGWGAGFS